MIAPSPSWTASSRVGTVRVADCSASSAGTSGQPRNVNVCAGTPSMNAPFWVTATRTVSGLILLPWVPPALCSVKLMSSPSVTLAWSVSTRTPMALFTTVMCEERSSPTRYWGPNQQPPLRGSGQ